MKPKRKRLVISYSRSRSPEQKLFVKMLFARLEALGVHDYADIWLDEEAHTGSDWHAEILAHFANADAYFILGSTAYTQSDYILQHEWPLIEKRVLQGAAKLFWISYDRPVKSYASPVYLSQFQTAAKLTEPWHDLPATRADRALTRLAEELGTFLVAAHEPSPASDPEAHTAESPATTPPPSDTTLTAERSWVWHATLESRAAGKISILACAETLFAVALYWWIAIHYDTHWHLLTSVFIAPLLLLRSPESIKLGVRWFMKDWFGFRDYASWPKMKRWLWLAGAAVLNCTATSAFASKLSELWLVGEVGETLIVKALYAGGITFVFSLVFVGTVAVAIALANLFVTVSKGSGMAASAITCVNAMILAGLSGGLTGGLIAGMAIGLGLAIGLGWGLVMIVFALEDKTSDRRGPIIDLIGYSLGLGLRGLAFRVAATLKHPLTGIRSLAENWRENNFWVDAFVPAELMPGIREEEADYAFDGMWRKIAEAKKRKFKWLGGPFMVIVLFLPPFLYRLNIKATCWFWWPLAFLLKPIPPADKTGEQKQALCWPWDNPLQRLLILVPALLVIAFLIYDYCDPTVWQQFKNAGAVPIPLKLALGMEWSHIPPWHWTLLIIEITGLGMLFIAGNACSHKANDNWDTYARNGMPTQLWLMHAFTRVRSIATITFLLLGLGMCLISFPEWRTYLPKPLLHRLETFYHAQEFPAPAP